jgi:hypothetical protein
MDSLGSIFGNKDKRSALMRGVAESMALEEANKLLISIFGETAKNNCQPVFIKNKILSLACLSSVLEEQIKARETEIVSNLNKKLGDQIIEKVRFLE